MQEKNGPGVTTMTTNWCSNNSSTRVPSLTNAQTLATDVPRGSYLMLSIFFNYISKSVDPLYTDMFDKYPHCYSSSTCILSLVCLWKAVTSLLCWNITAIFSTSISLLAWTSSRWVGMSCEGNSVKWAVVQESERKGLQYLLYLRDGCVTQDKITTQKWIRVRHMHLICCVLEELLKTNKQTNKTKPVCFPVQQIWNAMDKHTCTLQRFCWV